MLILLLVDALRGVESTGGTMFQLIQSLLVPNFSVIVALATSAILSSFVSVYFFRKAQTKQGHKERARNKKCGETDLSSSQIEDAIQVQQVQQNYTTTSSNRISKQENNFGDQTKPLEIISVYQRRLQDETEKRKALESQCNDLQNRLRNSELAAKAAKDMHDKLLKRYNVVSQKLKVAEERCQTLYSALNEAGIPEDEDDGYPRRHVVFTSQVADEAEDAFGCDRSSPECAELSESDDSLGYQASAGSSDDDDDESREFGDDNEVSDAEFELSENVMQLLVAGTIQQPRGVENSPHRDESYDDQNADVLAYNAYINRSRGEEDDLSDLLESNPPTDEDEDIDQLVARNSTDEDDVIQQLSSMAGRQNHNYDDQDDDSEKELESVNQGVDYEKIPGVASTMKMFEQRFAEQNSPLAARRFLDVPGSGDRSNASSRSASPAFLERLSRAEKRSHSPTIYDTVENHERSASPSFYNSSRSNSPLADRCARYEQRPHTSDSDSDHEPAHVRRRGSPRLSDDESVKDGHVSELRQQWESSP